MFTAKLRDNRYKPQQGKFLLDNMEKIRPNFSIKSKSLFQGWPKTGIRSMEGLSNVHLDSYSPQKLSVTVFALDQEPARHLFQTKLFKELIYGSRCIL